MRGRIVFIAVALYYCHETLCSNTLDKNDLPSTEESYNEKRSAFVEIASSFYYFEREKQINWYAAQHFCRARGAHLVTIETGAEMQRIIEYLKANNFVDDDYHWYSENWFWIGCNDIYNEGNYTWIGSGKPVEYTNWRKGQPDNAFDGEDCCVLWRHGEDITWNDQGCKFISRYICETNNPQPVKFTAFKEN